MPLDHADAELDCNSFSEHRESCATSRSTPYTIDSHSAPVREGERWVVEMILTSTQLAENYGGSAEEREAETLLIRFGSFQT